jgi:superoxide reductase
MELLKLNTEDEGKEKHVPVIEKTDDGIKIRVGSIQHPMEENHFIEWIEVISGEKIMHKFLKPGEAPEATFKLSNDGSDLQVREYCTVHGLWSA